MATIVSPNTTTHDNTSSAKIGIVDRVKQFFVGIKPAILKEEKVHVHWLSLAYMGVMSVFALQVFALQDLQTALSVDAKLADRIQSTMLVTVIIVAVFISDYAAPHARELAKLVGLRGEIGLAWMLRFYALCVYGTDGYAVITVLYRSVAHLPSTTPPPSIGPLSGAWTEVIIRGTLIVFTGWMIHTVTQRQYPTSNTLARRGSELMGGILLNRLATQNASQVETYVVAQWFRAFTEAAKRSPQFRFPRLPFFHDASADEEKQWEKLTQVMKAVESHPRQPLPASTNAKPAPLLPLPHGSPLLELIAGVIGTWQATNQGQMPNETQIAAAVVELGYTRPSQSLIRDMIGQLQTTAEEDIDSDASKNLVVIQQQNEVVSQPRSSVRFAPKAPLPSNTKFPKWVYEQAAKHKQEGHTLNYLMLTQYLNDTFNFNHAVEVYRDAMNTHRRMILDNPKQSREQNLQTIVNDSVFTDLDNNQTA